MSPRLERLDRRALEAHLDEVLEIDAGTLGETWSADQWRLDLPGKWECSRLAIESDGAVVGFLVGSVRAGALHVHRVAVRPDGRRSGLGTALLAEAGREARRRALDSVTLKVAAVNDGAIRFYDRLGFLPEGSGNNDNVFMRASAERLALAGDSPGSEERRCC